MQRASVCGRAKCFDCRGHLEKVIHAVVPLTVVHEVVGAAARMALGVVRRFESCQHLTQHEMLPHVACLAEVSVSHPATMPGATRAHHLVPGKTEVGRLSSRNVWKCRDPRATRRHGEASG